MIFLHLLGCPVLRHINLVIRFRHRGEIEFLGYFTPGEKVFLAFGGFARSGDSDLVGKFVRSGNRFGFSAEGNAFRIWKKGGRFSADVPFLVTLARDQAALEIATLLGGNLLCLFGLERVSPIVVKIKRRIRGLHRRSGLNFRQAQASPNQQQT